MPKRGQFQSWYTQIGFKVTKLGFGIVWTLKVTYVNIGTKTKVKQQAYALGEGKPPPSLEIHQ